MNNNIFTYIIISILPSNSPGREAGVGVLLDNNHLLLPIGHSCLLVAGSICAVLLKHSIQRSLGHWNIQYLPYLNMVSFLQKPQAKCSEGSSTPAAKSLMHVYAWKRGNLESSGKQAPGKQAGPTDVLHLAEQTKN